MSGKPGKPFDRSEAIELEQVCARIVSVGYDNGRTPGSSDGPGRPNFIRYQWEFVSSNLNLNGQDCDTGAFGPYTQWTPQLQGWADEFNQAFVDKGLDGRYFSAFGFKPAPTWRYNKVTTCDPLAVFGTWTITRDNDDVYSVYPVCKTEQIVTAWRYFTLDEKTGEKTVHWCEPDPDDASKLIPADAPMWEPIEGDPLQPIPNDCLVPCSFPFADCIAEDAISGCTAKTEETLCDLVGLDENEEPIKNAFVRIRYLCDDGSKPEPEIYTLDSWLAAQSDDDLVPYVIQGQVVYCEDCQAFDDCPDPQGVKIVPVKTITTDQVSYCAYLDGDLTNCDATNVVEFIRVFENCIVDGKLDKRTFTDFELDGVTPLDASAFTEATVSLECTRDDGGNLLTCHSTCYTFNPPIKIKQVKSVKSLEKLASLSRELKAISKKAVLSRSEKRRQSEIINILAVDADEPVSEPSKFTRGTCLRVVECCPCGDPTNIVSQEFFVKGPSDTDFSPVAPFEVTGEWEEKPCDPALDCPTADLVDLGDCTIAALEELLDDCKRRCTFEGVGTDRNGINNPFQNSNFVLTLADGTVYTGDDWASIVNQIEADGYTVGLECANAECHISDLSITGDQEVTSITYDNVQAGAISLTDPRCIELPCGWQLTQELIDLNTPCCEPRVVTDAICFAEDVQLGDLMLTAGSPVIRQITFNRTYNAETCACEDLVGDGAIAYYQFENPLNEITEDVEAATAEFSPCDPLVTNTRKQCTPDGTVYFITDISVDTSQGTTVSQTIYNEDGKPVELPENLGPCPGELYPTCGCIRNADGSIAVRGVSQWQGTDENGGIIYGGIFENTAEQGEVALAEGQSFDCDCSDKKSDRIPATKYSYDLSAAFPCDVPTVTIDSEVIELCDPANTGPASIPSSGDLHTVGGVRSNTTSGRCDPEPSADPAGLAAELQSFGSVGDDTVNPLATTTNTANAFIAVRNTFPVSGVATSIDITATWNVGSGIAIVAYDCSDGSYLDLTAGTPSTFPECGPSTRGPVDAWGSGNNGLTQTSTFAKPGNVPFNLEDIVFQTIVLNPPGDHLSGIQVNGEPPAASGCTADTIEDLLVLLNSETDEVWTANGSTLCVTTDKAMGPIQCGATAIDPTAEDQSVDIQAQYVAFPPSCQAVFDQMLEKLCSIDESLNDFNVIVTKDICARLLAFDFDRGLVQAGDTTAYRILCDGVEQATVVHDYLTSFDGLNVSTYYTPVIAAINAVPGLSMTLVQDVLGTEQGKPQWQLDYTGECPKRIEIQKAGQVASLGNNDTYIFDIDAAGNLTTAVTEGGPELPDFNSPVWSACE